MRIKFSLRVLLLAITALGIVFGGLAWQVHFLADQFRHIESLRSRGVWVSVGRVESFAGLWESLAGDHAVGVNGLSFHPRNGSPVPVTDKDWEWIRRWDRVRVLGLYGKFIDDDRVAEIVSHQNLGVLSIEESNITDQAGESIGEMSSLSVLAIMSSPFGDRGLQATVDRHADLQYLVLRDTKVTEVGIQAVGKLSKLYGLAFFGDGVTDAALQQLLSIRTPKDVGACGPQVTTQAWNSFRAALEKQQRNGYCSMSSPYALNIHVSEIQVLEFRPSGDAQPKYPACDDDGSGFMEFRSF